MYYRYQAVFAASSRKNFNVLKALTHLGPGGNFSGCLVATRNHQETARMARKSRRMSSIFVAGEALFLSYSYVEERNKKKAERGGKREGVAVLGLGPSKTCLLT